MGALSRLRLDASRAHAAAPFVTDCTNGLRTELSGTIFEQWVAKTANWLEAEFDAGLQLHVNLRAHWLWPVLVAALDEIEGAIVPAERADAVFRIGAPDDAELPVIAVHDHPMALPFREALPANHYDFFRDVRGGGDMRPAGPTHEEPLLLNGFSTYTALELLAAAPPIDISQRIALHVDALALETAEQLALLSTLPWQSRSSLVITDGSSSMTGELTTLDLTLPRA